MPEFDDTLNQLLSNPSAMSQILNLAKSLGGQSGDPSAASSSDADQAVSSSSASSDGQDPDLSQLNGLDPKMVEMMMKLVQEYNKSDDKGLALLSALRPFLKTERQAKMDRAIQLAKLTRVARAAFHALKGGEDAV